MANFETLQDVLDYQIDFQKSLGNSVPEVKTNFEHVQTALSHNIYQTIEFQEFMEASTEEERKEELIDYLLFMLNKFIFLGVFKIGILPYSSTKYELSNLLYTGKSEDSLAQCPSLAQIEQMKFITLIRKHCVFKPWKAKTSEDFTKTEKVSIAFDESLETFKRISNIVYSDYEDFITYLEMKLKKNVDRQNNGY